MSKEFVFSSASQREKPRMSAPRIDSSHFVPSMGGGTSCDGAGFLHIEISLPPGESLGQRSHGFYLRPESGLQEPDLLPTYPLKPVSVSDGRATVVWAWTWAKADPDGHYRWKINISSVGKRGSRSDAATLCVASDNSCDE